MTKQVSDVILLLKGVMKDCYGKVCNNCQDNLEDAIYILRELEREKQDGRTYKARPWNKSLGRLDKDPENGMLGDNYIKAQCGIDTQYYYDGTRWIQVATSYSTCMW